MCFVPQTAMTSPDILAEDRAQLRLMRLASVLEGCTLVTLICIAVPVKYLLGYPQATAIVGPIHGAAFLFYIWMLARTLGSGGWSASEIARLVIAPFIPFGAIVSERLLHRKQVALTASLES